MKVEETCSCGASLVIDEFQGGFAVTMRHVEDFRRTHRHEFAPSKAEVADKTNTTAIGYPLPEANEGYTTGGQEQPFGFARYRGATSGSGD